MPYVILLCLQRWSIALHSRLPNPAAISEPLFCWASQARQELVPSDLSCSLASVYCILLVVLPQVPSLSLPSRLCFLPPILCLGLFLWVPSFVVWFADVLTLQNSLWMNLFSPWLPISGWYLSLSLLSWILTHTSISGWTFIHWAITLTRHCPKW